MVYQKLFRFLSQNLPQPLSRCLLCNTASVQSHGICAPCQQQLPFLTHSCPLCALPLSQSAHMSANSCARCLQQPPAMIATRACWHYAYPVGQLIQRFKYHADLAAGHALTQLAVERLRPEGNAPQVLVPIPLHWRRQWRRGYNQAQLIAATFSRQWQIPLAVNLLRKAKASSAQQGLKRNQRLRNLRQSFHADEQVLGLHIGLIDDVITTGATFEAAAQTLLKAGAKEVSACALASTL